MAAARETNMLHVVNRKQQGGRYGEGTAGDDGTGTDRIRRKKTFV